MRDVAVVFARAPRLGTVKRRLARDIGDRAALRFHAAVLGRLLRGLAACRGFETVLAVTPDRAFVRVPAGVRVIGQGRGDLGARMGRALGRHRRVVLLGCDIPDAGVADVRAALFLLGRYDAVFGRADDGGFWLVGLGPRRPGSLFGDARWSTPHALADVLGQFRRHRAGFVRTLPDVDTAEDYWRHRRATGGWA
jgi:hypothetical protein